MIDFTLIDVELSIAFARDKYNRALQENTDEGLLRLMEADIDFLEELKLEKFSNEILEMESLVNEANYILSSAGNPLT
jgi:hypothetical protein